MTTGNAPVELTDPDELLWRNVHPTFRDGDQVTSQAFRPTPKDGGRLSTARQAKVTAADHYVEYVLGLGLTSAGVWAVTVGEVIDVGLVAWYDAESDQAPDPGPVGHSHLDFTDVSDARARKIGGQLRDKAVERGRQHP